MVECCAIQKSKSSYIWSKAGLSGSEQNINNIRYFGLKPFKVKISVDSAQASQGLLIFLALSIKIPDARRAPRREADCRLGKLGSKVPLNSTQPTNSQRAMILNNRHCVI